MSLPGLLRLNFSECVLVVSTNDDYYLSSAYCLSQVLNTLK